MINLVRNNTKPDLDLSLRKGGLALNLTGAASVTFKLRKPSGAIISKVMVVQAPATLGRVGCAWGVGDLDEAGECLGEVVVLYSDNTVQNSKYPISIYVREEFEEV